MSSQATVKSAQRSKDDATVRPEQSGEINRFPRVTLTAPSASSFLLLLAEVDRRPWWLVPASHVKSSLLKRLKTQIAGIASSANIASTVVFRAFLAVPRGHSAYLARRHAPAHRARFDVVVLIEAASPERIGEIRQMQSSWHGADRFGEKGGDTMEMSGWAWLDALSHTLFL